MSALELRFHFGERDRDGDRPLDAAVMDACERSGVRAAALLRGVEGFGRSATQRTDRLLSLSEDAPLVAVAVGETAKVEALAEEIKDLAGDGLMVLMPTRSATASAVEVGELVGGSPGDGGGEVVRATIWGPRTGSESPHLRAVDALHRHGAYCATVLLGVDGVLDGERRRARFVAGNRGVPATTVAVGARGAIDAAVVELGAVANLVTIEGGVRKSGVDRMARPDGSDDAVRVTLVTSEIAQGAEGPLYLEFIRELRRRGAAGATALRGVWGFRGEVAPHGDRLLALRRDVPLIVETVDGGERGAEWLEVAESLGGPTDLAFLEAVGRRFDLD